MVDRVITTKPTRPALRWHGGKFNLRDWVLSHFPPHRVYVEPFGGAASVLLAKTRSYAEVYNDLDGEVVNLFRVLRDRGEGLKHRLSLTPFARAEFKASYDTSLDSMERARQLVIRSFMGFGSNGHQRKTGFRSNSNRSGTTPAHDWANYPDALPAIIDRLRGVVIESKDAVEVMQAHDGLETLHYLDPPYVAETRGIGTDYAVELDDAGHLRILEAARSMAGMVVISGYPSRLYEEALRGWESVTSRALADGARERTEVLWLNEPVSIWRKSGRLF